MLAEHEIVQTLKDMSGDLPGFIAASLVDLDSGMTLGAFSSQDDFDISAASAFNSEMVKQKRKIMLALGLTSDLEDMLITLSDQIHLIRIVSPTTFIYLAADRQGSNIAIVRSAVAKYASALDA